mmetsp:Transcript_11492/g.33353  ORF Transcript_11492/g.33353 Transcript_11492/m.33353 type:complete len:87 (+) Transcript_11492:214-474(+)
MRPGPRANTDRKALLRTHVEQSTQRPTLWYRRGTPRGTSRRHISKRESHCSLSVTLVQIEGKRSTDTLSTQPSQSFQDEGRGRWAW